MSKTADQVKGILSSTKPKPPHIVMPTNLDLKFMSKEKAVEWTDRYKRALGVAEEAKAKVMSEPVAVPETVPANDQSSELDAVKEKLAEAQAKLAEDPENRSLKMKIGKLNKKLDKLENE